MHKKPLSPTRVPDPRPEMELAGHDGNIFAILGRADRLLKQSGQSDKAKEMSRRVFSSASYNEALGIISEYVHTELSEPISSPNAQKKENSKPKKARDANER